MGRSKLIFVLLREGRRSINGREEKLGKARESLLARVTIEHKSTCGNQKLSSFRRKKVVGSLRVSHSGPCTWPGIRYNDKKI